MRLLGLETSCDETAAAVVEDGIHVRASVVSSQVPIHRKYGGVVPELASRAHLEAVLPIVDHALEDAGLDRHAIDGVAVTRGPGLIGALMVGVHTAKAIAYALDRPLIGVNHIEAHIHGARLADRLRPDPPPIGSPCVALVVSGGHTALYRVGPRGVALPIGQTLDDAAGEAFDKVSTLLGLGYPGGRVIDDLARSGDPTAIAFPRAWLGGRRNDFSFSGLKTAVKNHVQAHGLPEGQALRDLCASFQEAVVHVLCRKTLRAATAEGVKDVVLAGGVAANSRLRERMAAEGARLGLVVHATPLRYCSDNAAMIAGLGYLRFQTEGPSDRLAMDATTLMISGAP